MLIRASSLTSVLVAHEAADADGQRCMIDLFPLHRREPLRGHLSHQQASLTERYWNADITAERAPKARRKGCLAVEVEGL